MPTIKELYEGLSSSSAEERADSFNKLSEQDQSLLTALGYDYGVDGKTAKNSLIAGIAAPELMQGNMTTFSRFGHKGYFSVDNPAYQLLLRAGNSQDAAALYELAVKWEIDRANLLEQRAYDDPSAQIARERAAGINPDLQGSSGSSGGSSASMPQQSNTTQFSNPYFEKQLRLQSRQNVIQGLSSVCNLISSVVGGVGSVLQLPSQLKMLGIQADIAQQTKENVIKASNSQSQILQNQATASGLSNISSAFNNFANVASLFTPESTDEDMTSVLQTFGYKPEDIPAHIGAIRQWHTNPNFKAPYHAAVRQSIENEQYNNKYTSEVVAGIIDFQYKLDRSRGDFEFHTQNIRTSVAEILDNPEYIELLASNDVNTAKLQANQTSFANKELSFATEKLNRNIEAQISKLEGIKESVNSNQSAIDEIYSTAKLQGRNLTNEETATINRLTYFNLELNSLGSEELNEMFDIMNQADRMLYMNSRNLVDGYLTPINVFGKRVNHFATYTFGSFCSDEDGTQQLVNGLKAVAPKQLQPFINLFPNSDK